MAARQIHHDTPTKPRYWDRSRSRTTNNDARSILTATTMPSNTTVIGPKTCRGRFL